MNPITDKMLFFQEIILKDGFDFGCKGSNNLEINDPISKSIIKFQEIENFLQNVNAHKKYQFLYFIWKRVSYILYDEDKVIDINKVGYKNMQISHFFYLDLILMYNKEIVDLGYNFDFIEGINNIQKNIENEKFRKLIFAKIIIDLINKFEDGMEYEDEQKDDLNDMKEFNEKIIDENLEVFKENIGKMENNFQDIDIDIIYSFILDELIKKNKFQDYNFVEVILKQLDYENITLTNVMLESLKKTLNSSEQYINNYKMIDFEDIFNNNTKLNFYYLLYKYILKNTFYIYQIDFLIDFKKFLKHTLKEKAINVKSLLNELKNENIKDKIIEIIKFYTDSEYYYNQLLNININKDKPSEKKSENSEIVYLNHYEFKIDFNDIKKRKKIDTEREDIQNHRPIYYNDLKKYLVRDIEKLKKKITDNNIFKEKLGIKTSNRELKNLERFERIIKNLESYFNQIYSLYNNNFVLQFIFNREKDKEKSNDDDDDDEFYNITCQMNLLLKEIKNKKQKRKEIKKVIEQEQEQEVEKLLKSFKDKDFFKKGFFKSQGFLYLKRNTLKMYKYPSLFEKSIESPNISFISSNSDNFPKSDNFEKCKFYSFDKIKAYLTRENYNEIMTIEKIISEHMSEAELILETKHHYFISCGIENDIVVYSQNFSKIRHFFNIDKDSKDLQNTNETIQSSESNSNDYLEISGKEIICSNQGINLIKIDDTNRVRIDIKKYKNEPSIFLCTMGNNTSVLVTKKQFIVLANSNQELIKQDKELVGGIQLGLNTAAFTSNSCLTNGENKLYFYDAETKEISEFKLKEEYSFTSSKYSMKLMPNQEGEKIYLLCGCTKYKEGQRNGIVIININKVNDEFYDTGDFEVYCFCPISVLIEKKSKDKSDDKKIKKSRYATNYFFAGGFDKAQKKGTIKLFRLNYPNESREQNNKKIIEFVQDVSFENKRVQKLSLKNKSLERINNKNSDYISDYEFSGFQMNISCIIQSKKTGKILITSWDGNVYLFSAPNISYYLNKDHNKI